MAVTNYTNVEAAAGALTNAAARQGLTTSTSIGAQQLPMSVLANIMAGQAGGAALLTGPGAGVTSGVGTIARTGLSTSGGLIITSFIVDLTGLASSTTDLDIIGVGVNPAFLGQITTAENGVIIGGSMTCLEVPAGGVTDIDLYVATAATGKFDDAVTGLAGQAAVVTSGGAWTLGRVLGTAPDAVINNGYLYLTGGAAGTAATYTAGRYLITLYGV